MLDNTSDVRVIRDELKKVGVSLPPKLEDELEKIDAAHHLFPEVNPDDLGRAALDAHRAGRDPATDKEFTTLLLAHHLNRAVPESRMGWLTGQDRRAAVAKYSGELFTALTVVVAHADATLVAARAAVPGLDLENPASITGLSPPNAAHWAEGRAAREVVRAASFAWKLLNDFTQRVQVTQRSIPLVLADLSAVELDRVGRTAYEVVDAGYRLSLADPEEYQERLARVVAEREAARKRRIEAFNNPARRVR